MERIGVDTLHFLCAWLSQRESQGMLRYTKTTLKRKPGEAVFT